MEEPTAATNGHTENEAASAEAPPAEVDPEVKQLVFDWITDTLHKAWRSQEAERKKIIKQLMLKWHPDKNKDDPALSLVATQFIQSEVERLENGLPRMRTTGYTGSSTRSRFGNDEDFQRRYEEVYRGFADELRRKREEYERQSEERDRIARQEQQQRAREREEQWRRYEEQRQERERELKEERDNEKKRAKERREQYEREKREREEARRALFGDKKTNGTANGTENSSKPRAREPLFAKAKTEKAECLSDEEKVTAMLDQAAHDLKAAENDMNLDSPAHEWACMKAHQAAEKAIKALHFHRIGLKSNSHELTSLATTIRDAEIMELTSRLHEIIGHTNKLYNLILLDFSVIPHDDFSTELALEAMMCAGDILERVKTLINEKEQ